jgi:hypothetical protein
MPTEEQYDENGWDALGRHRDTGNTYDPDGYDIDGNSRCDNGDCDDDTCERCHPEPEPEPEDDETFDEQLHAYNAKATDIHGWFYAPMRLANGGWSADRTLYAGHEIEMYSDNEDYDDVLTVLRQLDTPYRNLNPQTRTNRCAIAKHDGSLDVQDGGFEAVTVPLTRAQTYGIFESFKIVGDGNCSAWNMGNEVGHHIHLSRAAIGPLTLGKLLVFANADANQRFVERVACRPAEFNGFSSKKLTDAMREEPNGDRYEVINVTTHTVEFRMFKSNLMTRAILKNYEFAVSLTRYCEQVTHGMDTEPEWSSHPLHYLQYRRWVAEHHAEYPYLHQFFLAHPSMSQNYRSSKGLKANAIPKDRSPKFAFIRTLSAAGGA